MTSRCVRRSFVALASALLLVACGGATDSEDDAVGEERVPAADAKVVSTPSGVVAPVVGHEGDALVVGTPCGSTATLVNASPVSGEVVLDSGHGGVDPGAIGPTGLTESALNLAVTEHARDALEDAGISVVQTRTGDYSISIAARAAIVEALRPRAMVSIHHNAVSTGHRDSPGTETYYQARGASAAESKRLAGLVYEEVVAALAPIAEIEWAANGDAGAKHRIDDEDDDYYGILRMTHGTPSVIAELGFISHDVEEALYRDPAVQRVEGEAVARGIERFLTTDDPGSGYVVPFPQSSEGGGPARCDEPPLE
jgi:N-acetylmuramoyl-L-alanine amidase